MITKPQEALLLKMHTSKHHISLSFGKPMWSDYRIANQRIMKNLQSLKFIALQENKFYITEAGKQYLADNFKL